MNKKGFTLIELLAIIVILAAIAMIGFPIVTNIINTSRIAAAARTCDGVVDAVENLYSMSVMKDPNFAGATIVFKGTGVEVTPKTAASFDYSGTVPQSGTITIKQDGTYEWGQLIVNTYICDADPKGHYTCKAPSSSEIPDPEIP